MSRTNGVNRRQLFLAGPGVLGVAILGIVTACSGPSRDGSGGASSGAGSSPSGSPASTGSASGPASGSAPGPAPVPSDPLTWKRVPISFVSAYLLVRGNEVAVVDLGVERSHPRIESALKAAGSGWGAVRHVILTHRHPDHVGSLPTVEPLVKATFYAGGADSDAIVSDRPLVEVKDGDEVFGLRIVGTPGHTPGHVSVFDQATGVLVAGDALRTRDGLEGSDPQYTSDVEAARASVKKLAGLDVRVILPGHGDPLTADASGALKRLAATL